MVEKGRVIELTPKGAKIEVTPSPICGSCAQAEACSASREKTKIILAQNPIGAKIGDLVKIELKEKSRTTAVLLVFGLPIFFLLIGIIVGEIIAGDKLAISLGGSGLVIAFILIKLIDRWLSKKTSFLPTIIERVIDAKEEQ